MIPTGETEVLGEKHYKASVVEGWMSMEHWWNYNDRPKPNNWQKSTSVPSATILLWSSMIVWRRLLPPPSPSHCKVPN